MSKIDKIENIIIWGSLIILGIIISPILLIIGIYLVARELIVEITQEYRCMSCGKWIPKEKRKDPTHNWCSKECYYNG